MALGFISGYVMGRRGAGKAAGLATSAAQFGSQDSYRVYELDDRIDRLTLVIQAMWSLLEEQGLTQEQLEARILELDGSDGRVDGLVIPDAQTCPECGAKVNPGAGKCQFCGYELGDSSPFAGI